MLSIPSLATQFTLCAAQYNTLQISVKRLRNHPRIVNYRIIVCVVIFEKKMNGIQKWKQVHFILDLPELIKTCQNHVLNN